MSTQLNFRNCRCSFGSLPQLLLQPQRVAPVPDFTWARPCRCFSDGFPNLFVRDALDIRSRHVAFLGSFHEPATIFEQVSVIYQLPRLFIGSFTLVLPFFPTGTLERVEAEGEVATAFTLARMLSHIPLTRGGPASIVIFDIHALQVRASQRFAICSLQCAALSRQRTAVTCHMRAVHYVQASMGTRSDLTLCAMPVYASRRVCMQRCTQQ